MKFLRNFMLLIIGAVVLLFAANQWLLREQTNASKGTINFYNWGDYIDPELIAEFEAETGYTIIYETFDSNEAMLTKLQQGGTNYDLIVPSEYMVERLKEENLLQKIDLSKIPNRKHIGSRFINMDFDPGNEYTLPYFWGTLGILYNHRELGEGAIQQWEDLWNPEYESTVMMVDGAREVMGIGLQQLGYSLNSTDEEELVEAAQLMKTLTPNILAFITDELKMHMVNEESTIGVTYSGDAVIAIDANPDLTYVVPSDGSNFWSDNFAIPTNADNVEGAHALMDFLCRPDVAARNAEYIGYATPNESALEFLDPEITEDDALYPAEDVMDHLEVYRNLGQETLIRYNDLYLEIKIEPRS